MELFSLPCTTCNTRLKVRDESVVGKILACPKCGGMVLVKPPADWQPGKKADLGPSTITATPPSWSSNDLAPRERATDANFDEIENLLASPQMPPPTSAGAPSTPSRSAPEPDPVPPAPSKSAAAPAKSPLPKSTASVPPTPAPNPHGNPKAAAVVAAASPAAPIVKSPQAPATAAVAGNPPLAGEVSTAALATAIPAAPSAFPPPPGAADWSADRPWRYWLVVGASAFAGVLLALSVVAVSIRMMRPTAETIAIAPPPKIVEEFIPEEVTETIENPAETPADSAPAPVDPPPNPPVAKVDPPPVEPAAAPADPLDLTKPIPAAPPKPAGVFGNLDKFGPLLNNTTPQGTQPVDDSNNPPLPVETAPDKPRVAQPRPQQRKVDVAARLADPLPKIEADGVAVVDFLQLMSELSTIPMTLEPDALAMGRSSPIAPVKLTGVQTTVGKALAEGLKSVQLEFTQVDNQLIVALPKGLRTITIPLDDLAGAEAEGMEGMASLITETIAPGTWGTAGGPALQIKDNAGQVRHELPVLWRVIELTEKLRTARGLKHRSKFDPRLFELSSRTERARERLATPVSLNFPAATSFTRILDRLAGAAGMRIIVDWRSAAAAGWNSDAEATLTVDKSAFGEALDDLLSPMELTWRLVDETTVQVIALESLGDYPELEIYPLPEEAAGAEQAARLIDVLKRDLGDRTLIDGGGKGVLRYDAPSKALIVVLPQDKQRRVESAIRSLRAAK